MKFCYNTSFTFLNNPKNLDPSYKMDLDFWIVLEGKKVHLIPNKYDRGDDSNEGSHYNMSLLRIKRNYVRIIFKYLLFFIAFSSPLELFRL